MERYRDRLQAERLRVDHDVLESGELSESKAVDGPVPAPDYVVDVVTHIRDMGKTNMLDVDDVIATIEMGRYVGLAAYWIDDNRSEYLRAMTGAGWDRFES